MPVSHREHSIEFIKASTVSGTFFRHIFIIRYDWVIKGQFARNGIKTVRYYNKVIIKVCEILYVINPDRTRIILNNNNNNNNNNNSNSNNNNILLFLGIT